MFYDLRETRGLTYGAYAYCRSQALLRAMILYGSASLEHSGAFVEGMLQHLALLKKEQPQLEEVDAIKRYYLGQNLINEDGDNGMGVMQLLEPDNEFAEHQRLMWLKVYSPKDIQHLAEEYLSAIPLVVVRGDADVIVTDLKEKLPDWDISFVEK